MLGNIINDFTLTFDQFIASLKKILMAPKCLTFFNKPIIIDPRFTFKLLFNLVECV